MTHTHHAGRREFLKRSALASGSLLVAGFAGAARGQPAQPQGKDQKAPAADDVTPVEDLMREHGALRRILLIYEEAIKRIDARVDLPPEPLVSAADLVRRFVEDYHEKLEENHLFPRFEKAAKLGELVVVLQAQHQAGRRLTDQIRQRATAAALKSPAESRILAESLRAFLRLYRPHAAREDTVLFPAFRALVTPAEYDKLGDEFEDQENKLFGADGFEKVVGDVAALEKTLGIYDLAQFTPQAKE